MKVRQKIFDLFMFCAKSTTELKNKNLLPHELGNKIFDYFWFRGCYMITVRNKNILSILITGDR